MTTHVSASVQTGEPTNLARQCDPIGRGEPRLRGRAEVGGCARSDHGLTTVVTARGQRFVVKIREESRKHGGRCPPCKRL
jgi:hypothetical protein